jgi:hypothetical protein
VWRWSGPGVSYGIAIQGNLAYLAQYDRGLRIVDFSNNNAPTLVSSVEGIGSIYGVAVTPSHAFLAQEGGIVAIDISNPAVPVVVGSLNLFSVCTDIALDGNLAYLSASYDGVKIVDVSDPAHPALVAAVDLPGYATEIEMDAYYAYVKALTLEIIERRNPAEASRIGVAGYGLDVRGIEVANGLVYFTDNTRLAVLPSQCDALSAAEIYVAGSDAERWIESFPNPARGATRIRLTLKDAGFVSLTVTDVAGRAVRRLTNGWFGAGHHEAVWDGRGEGGRAVDAGIYWIRGTSGDRRSAVSVSVVR